MKRKQRQARKKALKVWLEKRREENLKMALEGRNVKARKHRYGKKDREEKRRKTKWNKRRRFLLWKRRHRKKLKGNVEEGK